MEFFFNLVNTMEVYCYIRIDQLVADLAGKEDVRAKAKLIPESLTAHGLP